MTTAVAIHSQAKEVAAASVAVISVLSLKTKLAAVVTVLSVVDAAAGAGVHAQQISAVATSQVLPSELIHHVTLMTTNNHHDTVITLKCSVCAARKHEVTQNI